MRALRVYLIAFFAISFAPIAVVVVFSFNFERSL